MIRNARYPMSLDDLEDIPLEFVDISELGEHSTAHMVLSEFHDALNADQDDTLVCKDEPEFYDFEDYQPALEISGSGALNNSLCDGVYFDFGHKHKSRRTTTTIPNGKQLVRSYTSPAAPVSEQSGTTSTVEQQSNGNDNMALQQRISSSSKKLNGKPSGNQQRRNIVNNGGVLAGMTMTRTFSSPAKPISILEGNEEESLLLKSYPTEARRKRALPKTPMIRSNTVIGTAWILDDEVSTKDSSKKMSGKSPTTTPNQDSFDLVIDTDRCSPNSRGNGHFSRFTRRLSQRERKDVIDTKDRPRSQSIDCGGSKEDVNDRIMEVHSTSAPFGLNKEDFTQTISGGKLVRQVSGGKRKGSIDSGDSISGKGDRKKSEKDRKTFDIAALFDAVEHQDMDLVRTILNAESLDVNSVNNEDLTPLDVAVMTNHVPMAKMLLSHGAKENPMLSDGAILVSKLDQLVCDAEEKVENLTTLVVNGNSSQIKENERNLSHWEFRHRLLKRMKAGYDYARIPDAPTNVRLSVTSATSLVVRFDEPDTNNSAVVTKYKVEWSLNENFTPIVGDYILEDLRHLEYEIPNLLQGTNYFVRVFAWNIKGYGPVTITSPSHATPSSWRELGNTVPRAYGKLTLLDDLFSGIKETRPADATEIKGLGDDKSTSPSGSPVYQRKSSSHNMKRSIKSLFASAPKFQKNLKSRGVYLACLLYNEDRILVTTEENLPIIEVDENFSSVSLHADFHWLMKIACTWEDVKLLKQDMDKSSSASTVHLRSKLLQAAGNLQSSLGIQDLGQFYYKPIKDSNGSIVLTTVTYIKDPKMVSSASVKWMPLGKIQRKFSSCNDLMSAPDMLVVQISDMILYHQVSTIPLPRGLYLGYLKLRSTVDLIRVIVQEKRPNILPYTKIRDCPNVSKEEWQWVKALSENDINEMPTSCQADFQELLIAASKRLLTHLDVSDVDSVGHRIYDLEVLEFGNGVNFILLMPPAESVCSVPCHSEEITERQDCLALPVQVFEMIHMCTYQYDFISRYSRLSSILEMDIHLAQQAQRQAFSSDELALAKDRLEQLSQFQNSLDEAWRGMRWTMDIITNARDKNLKGGVSLSVLYAPMSPNDSPSTSRKDADSDILSEHSDTGYQSDRSSTSTSIHDHRQFKLGPSNGYMSDVNCNTTKEKLCARVGNNNHSGILRVYAAYETGLAKGTSVKLHVTLKTTSREVINLVIQQLNKAVCLKGLEGPVYSDDQLDEFCLVAVLGARERVFRDDYQPLQLQNPWTKGRLFVRHKHNLFAAIEQVQSTTV